MKMPHLERKMWCDEISKINKKASQEKSEPNRIALW